MTKLNKDNPSNIIINISGQNFVSTVGTLLKYPKSRLGKLVRNDPSGTNYFFESDAEIFKEVLKFYIGGELHCPKNICYSDFLSHLEFWEVAAENISECCIQEAKSSSDLDKQFDYFNKNVKAKTYGGSKNQKAYLIWCFLTDPFGPDTQYRAGSKAFAVGYLLFTLFSALQSAISTLPAAWNNVETNSSSQPTRLPDIKYNTSCEGYNDMWLVLIPDVFGYLNLLCFIVYAIEIWIRFITCPNKRKFWKSINGVDMLISLTETVFYVIALFGIFVVVPNADQFENSSSLCVAAFCAQMIIVGVGQMRYLRLLSYASVYSGLKVLLITFYRSWKELILLVSLLTMSVLIFGPMIYFSSITATDQENTISSVPSAYWFVIVTMTTVGYGDMYPTTFPGYLVTIVVMLVGLTITALPIAIVGGNFAVVYEHNQKREKEELKANYNSTPEISK
ncbi:potassium voltage-gated channel protein Shaw-like [Watersipora subatra]|uniref:potassium voltage-gated channel protein Shaw-like n=1 Tax=Watersipora subatra TaxID=2589382 RepID=UPI00355C4D2C